VKFIYKKHEKYPDFILVREFLGTVSVNDIIDSWEYLIENKLLTSNLKGVINDLSNCTLNMDMNSFETLMKYLKSNEILKSLRLAVITNNPHNIVFPIIAELEKKDLEVGTFSTLDASVNWIIQ